MRRFVVLILLLGALPAAPGRASTLVFRGIRPGSWMHAPSLCTMNFVFNATGRLADGGPFYLGTAKHCVGSGDPRGRPVQLGLVLDSDEPVALTIGVVSHATKGSTEPDRDYALVKIDERYEHLISPSVAITGGPTSVWTGGGPEPILLVGHGVAIGTGGTARPGWLTGTQPPSSEYGYGAIVPVAAGDSGGVVMTQDGQAIGVTSTDPVSTYGMGRGELPPGPSTLLGTRVTRVAVEWGLHVVTCPSMTPWPGYGCPPA